MTCRAGLVHDRKQRLSKVRLLLPWTWAGHALARMAAVQPLTLVRCAFGVYRWTVGALVAALSLLWVAVTWSKAR